jgi:hypothetical protein
MVSQLDGRFEISDSIGLEDDPELWIKVFSAREFGEGRDSQDAVK